MRIKIYKASFGAMARTVWYIDKLDSKSLDHLWCKWEDSCVSSKDWSKKSIKKLLGKEKYERFVQGQRVFEIERL